MSRSLAPIRHLHAPKPLHFPTEEKVPEEREHSDLKRLVYDVFQHAFQGSATLGCDQFVYWNGSDPKKCLAPDAFVYWGTPDQSFRSWKTWERGTMQTAVEIASVFERTGGPWPKKLGRYKELGVSELVYFDYRKKAGERLLIWDRIDDDLVQRAVTGDVSVSLTLSGRDPRFPKLFWVVTSAEYPPAVRLAEDPAGERLLLTAREAAEQAREAAERRVAELEAELAAARR